MILYICQDGILPSGVATYGYHILQRYSDARMILLNASSFPPAAPANTHGQIHLVPEDKSHSPMALKETLRQCIAATAGEVILMPNTGDTPWAATAGFLKESSPDNLQRIKVLGIVHSDMESQYSLAELYWPIAPVWIGVSRRCAQVLTQRLVGHLSAIHTLTCPVPIPAQAPQWQSVAPLHLAYVGRLEEPQKKISRLAPLFLQLQSLGIHFQATIVGDGPAANELRASLSVPKIKDRVRFTGSLSRQAIDLLWPQIDIFLLVSAYEGLPLALLEAMAAGRCPVVMQVDSGLPDLLVDGHNARVVPQGDVDAMAQVVKELSNDRPQLKRLGQQARQDVIDGFSTGQYFQKFEEILQQLRAAPPPEPHRITADPTEQAVTRLTGQLAAQKSPVVVYGGGMFGRKVVDACLTIKIPVAAIIDSNPARTGTFYNNIQCHSPVDITSFAHCVFAVGSLQFAGDITKTINQAFNAENKPSPSILSVSL